MVFYAHTSVYVYGHYRSLFETCVADIFVHAWPLPISAPQYAAEFVPAFRRITVVIPKFVARSGFSIENPVRLASQYFFRIITHHTYAHVMVLHIVCRTILLGTAVLPWSCAIASAPLECRTCVVGRTALLWGCAVAYTPLEWRPYVFPSTYLAVCVSYPCQNIISSRKNLL